MKENRKITMRMNMKIFYHEFDTKHKNKTIFLVIEKEKFFSFTNFQVINEFNFNIFRHF